MARRMSRLNRATAAARSQSRSCSSERRNVSTSMSGPRLIQPHSWRARLRSSLVCRRTSVCRSDPLQHRRLSAAPVGEGRRRAQVLKVTPGRASRHFDRHSPVEVLTMFLTPE